MCPDDGFHGRWTEKRLREEAIGDLPFASLWEAVRFTCHREHTLRPLTEAEKIDYLVHHPELSVPDYRLEDQRVTREGQAMLEWLADHSTASTPDPQAIYTPSSDDIRLDRHYAIAAELPSIDEPTSKFRRWLDTLDNEETRRDYLCHMLDHCPWLSKDWERPGPATSEPITTAVFLQLLEQMADTLRELPVTSKEAKEQQRNTKRRSSPLLSLEQFGQALSMTAKAFKKKATSNWGLERDMIETKDGDQTKGKWTVNLNLVGVEYEERINDHARKLTKRRKPKKKK